MKLAAGSSRSLSPKLSPEKFADEHISYSVKDKSVATVSSKGKIKGKKPGKTKLTISAGGNSSNSSNNSNGNGYFSNDDDEYF